MRVYRCPHAGFACEVCGQPAALMLSAPAINWPRPICANELPKLQTLQDTISKGQPLGPYKTEIEWRNASHT